MRTVMVCLVLIGICYGYKWAFVDQDPAPAPVPVAIQPPSNEIHDGPTNVLTAPVDKDHRQMGDVAKECGVQGTDLSTPADKDHHNMSDLDK